MLTQPRAMKQSVLVQAAIQWHQRQRSWVTHGGLLLAERPQELQLCERSRHGSTAGVNARVLSALDLCTAMVSTTFPQRQAKIPEVKAAGRGVT